MKSLRRENLSDECPTFIPIAAYSRISVDGLTSDQWESATEAERREISLIEHSGGSFVEREIERINEAADPATMAALDAILADELEPIGQNVATSPKSYLLETSRQSCAAPMLRKKGGAFEVVWFACKSRKCSNCADRWKSQKIVDLGTIVDRLSGSDMDAPTIALNVGLIREDEWRSTSTRIRRHDAGAFSVPLSDDLRLVVTDYSDFGSPRPADIVLDVAAEALEQLSGRSDEKRHVRFSKNWKDIADAHKPAKVAEEGVEWLGIATKATTPAKIEQAAERAGGVAAPVASLEDEITDALIWRAKVPEQTEWKFLQLVGFKSFTQIAEERAERKAMLSYDMRERESQRQRKARRELVAA